MKVRAEDIIVFIVSETSIYCRMIKFCPERLNHAFPLRPLTVSHRKLKRGKEQGVKVSQAFWAVVAGEGSAQFP